MKSGCHGMVRDQWVKGTAQLSCWIQKHAARIGRVAAVLVMLSAPAARCQAPSNLLPNGGMEQWDSTTGLPAGWGMMRGGSPAAVHRDTQTVQSGASALRVELGENQTEAWMGEDVGGIHPDTEYRLAGYIRTSPGAKLVMILNVELNLGGQALPAAATWTEFHMDFNSRDCTTINVGLRVNGTGTIWVDGMTLTQIGKAGASITPDRAELLKLTAYQKDAVDPSTNTGAWTQSYRRSVTPARLQTLIPTTKVAAKPHWKVGEWARYLCNDQLLVKGGKQEKLFQITLIDCKIVGTQQVDGATYYWYQSVVRVRRYWVEKVNGRADTGQKILLDRPQKAVLMMLVDGPNFKDIRRYMLKVDKDPLLEYTDGKQAVLPRLNIDHLLIRPMGETGKGAVKEDAVLAASVPVTAMRSFTYHGPQLDRTATLVNWGDSGASNDLAGEKPTIVTLAHPPYLAVAFDGFGGLDYCKQMAQAGVELFQDMTVTYLGEAREFFNQVSAYFFDDNVWDTNEFDIARSNFIGWGGFMDEPYHRQIRWQDTMKSASNEVEAADIYSASIKKRVEGSLDWPGTTVADYDSPASVSWYSARVGMPGFILENARLGPEMDDIKRLTGLADQREMADAIDIACLAGAASQFGGWYGEGLYKWSPEQYYRDDLAYYAAHGATYLGFWIEGGLYHQDPQFKYYHTVLSMIPDIKKTIHQVAAPRPKAAALILVPNGYVLGLAGSDPVKPWGIVSNPGGQKLTDDVIRKCADLFKQRVTFDIMVDDPANQPDTSGYANVYRFQFPSASGGK